MTRYKVSFELESGLVPSVVADNVKMMFDAEGINVEKIEQ